MTELLYFSAKWCNPCKRVLPLVQGFAMASGHRVTVLDIEDAPETAVHHSVKTVPTIVAVRGGVTIGRHVGANISTSILEELVK